MNNNPLDIFRIRMKETRTRKNITLKEIAESVGCKEATIQRYESGNGIKSVPYETLVAIADTLGVSPQYLLGWEKPKLNSPELLADIAGDSVLLDYIDKIKNLTDSDKEKVYSYIDYIHSSNK